MTASRTVGGSGGGKRATCCLGNDGTDACAQRVCESTTPNDFPHLRRACRHQPQSAGAVAPSFAARPLHVHDVAVSCAYNVPPLEAAAAATPAAVAKSICQFSKILHAVCLLRVAVAETFSFGASASA